TARTTASARHWPGWKRPWRCPPCSGASPSWRSPSHRTSWNRCPASSPTVTNACRPCWTDRSAPRNRESSRDGAAHGHPRQAPPRQPALARPLTGGRGQRTGDPRRLPLALLHPRRRPDRQQRRLPLLPRPRRPRGKAIMDTALGLLNLDLSESPAADRAALHELAARHGCHLTTVLTIDEHTYMPTTLITHTAHTTRASAIL